MSNKKQTAVEYLHYEFMKVFGELQINTSLYYDLVYSFSQAKAMEKEQGKELYFEATKYACSCYEGPTKEDFEEDYQKIYQDENSKD
jgi:hypothetical protein